MQEKVFTSWIGTDESGKGDYFGPLVVAGIYVEREKIDELRKLGVRDSKRITSDKVIKEISKSLCKKGYLYSIVSIGPEKYNKLYDKIKNLNRLLAWGHARVIENLLSHQIRCEKVVTDQFGDEKFVLNALMEKGKRIFLELRPKAEDDLAVAAASILARAEFIERLQNLSQEIGFDLPRGAGSIVEEKAVLLVQKHGESILNKVAKLHFKITNRITNKSQFIREGKD